MKITQSCKGTKLIFRNVWFIRLASNIFCKSLFILSRHFFRSEYQSSDHYNIIFIHQLWVRLNNGCVRIVAESVSYSQDKSDLYGWLPGLYTPRSGPANSISRYFPITIFFYKLSTNTTFCNDLSTNILHMCFGFVLKCFFFFKFLLECPAFITYFLAVRMHFLFCPLHAFYCGPTATNSFDWKLSKFWFHSSNSNNMIFQLFASHLLWAAFQQNIEMRRKGKKHPRCFSLLNTEFQLTVGQVNGQWSR